MRDLMLTQDVADGGVFVQFVVDVDGLVIAVQGTLAPRVFGPYESWSALLSAYPAVFAEVLEPFEAELIDTEVEPMDLTQELGLERRRSGVEAPRAFQDWLGVVDEIDTLLAAVNGDVLERALPAYVQHLAHDPQYRSFVYVLEIETTGEPAPIGASKRGGMADLPPDLPWPERDGEPTTLLMQINLAEAVAADRSGELVLDGLLSVFITRNGHGVLVHTPGGAVLERRAPPTRPSYLARLMANEVGIRFRPGFYLLGDRDPDGPGALARALPAELLATIEERTGCRPSDAYSGTRMLGGDPVWWQGEDYLGEPLFLQIDFGEGHVSVGVPVEDLWAGVFEHAVVAYCGT